jgi:spore coat protein U-like protein
MRPTPIGRAVSAPTAPTPNPEDTPMKRNSPSVSRLAASIALAAAVVTPSAFAQQATAIMPVTASIAPNCLVSAQTLAFGNYDPIGANGSTGADLSAAAAVDVACTQGASATIALGEGQNFTGGVRRMSSSLSSGVLVYELFVDAAQSLAWPSQGVEYTGTGSETSVAVYGRIPRAQNQPVAGDYTDVVNVSVTF